MNRVNCIDKMAENSVQAQILHQNGTLVFANIAAAHIFGFDTIVDFVRYVEKTALFRYRETLETTPETRILDFRCAKGKRKSAYVVENVVDWHGAPLSWLALTPRFKPATRKGYLNSERAAKDETFILDTLQAAQNCARSDGDSIAIRNQPFDFAKICMKLCDDLTEYAESKNVSLGIEIKPRAQKIFAGDGVKMARAASCLVRHAINRTSDSQQAHHVNVTLRAAQDSDHIMFEVCDSAAPYSTSEAMSAFDVAASTQSSDRDVDATELCDLGLARCLARFLGGEIAVKIDHPGGGLVRMKLPFHKVEHITRAKPKSSVGHQALDILVVEDNVTSQHVITVILDALGHRTTIASNGQECLDVLLHTHFDVILMDLYMPVLDGYSAIQNIRKNERSGVLRYHNCVPILAITADRRPEARTRALACGATGFLTKPVHIPQFLEALAPFIHEVTTPSEKPLGLKRA